MEILVVLTIFSTVTVAITDIFLLSQRAEQRAAGIERASSDARAAMETIVRAVRTGTIVYDPTDAPLPVPSGLLTVKNQSGTTIAFQMSVDPASCPGGVTPCLLVSENGVSASLTPATMRVDDIRFLISPTRDPYRFNPATGSYSANSQPRVTIVMRISVVGKPVSLTLQTTVGTRQYGR